MRHKVGRDRFSNGSYELSCWIAVVMPAHVVRVNRFPDCVYRREIRVGSLGKFGSNAPAAIGFVQVIIAALDFSKVAKKGIIFKIMTYRIRLADVRAELPKTERDGPPKFATSPNGQCMTTCF